MKILIIILVTVEFIFTIYTYAKIRDICGHINDVLELQDIKFARQYYMLENCQMQKMQENKSS